MFELSCFERNRQQSGHWIPAEVISAYQQGGHFKLNHAISAQTFKVYHLRSSPWSRPGAAPLSSRQPFAGVSALVVFDTVAGATPKFSVAAFALFHGAAALIANWRFAAAVGVVADAMEPVVDGG